MVANVATEALLSPQLSTIERNTVNLPMKSTFKNNCLSPHLNILSPHVAIGTRGQIHQHFTPAFMHTNTKSAKIQSSCQRLFALLGSECVIAARKMLAKLTQGWTRFFLTILLN